MHASACNFNFPILRTKYVQKAPAPYFVPGIYKYMLAFLFYFFTWHFWLNTYYQDTTTKHTGVHQEAYTDVDVFLSLNTYQAARFYVVVHLIFLIRCNYFPFFCLHLQQTYTEYIYM